MTFLRTSLIAAIALAAATGPGLGKSADICLTATDIDHTTAISDREILFYLKDGKTWKNTLHKTCTGLRFEQAFTEQVSGNEICSNRQVIQVARRDTPCFLGDFAPYSPPTERTN